VYVWKDWKEEQGEDEREAKEQGLAPCRALVCLLACTPVHVCVLCVVGMHGGLSGAWTGYNSFAHASSACFSLNGRSLLPISAHAYNTPNQHSRAA